MLRVRCFESTLDWLNVRMLTQIRGVVAQSSSVMTRSETGYIADVKGE